MIKPTSGNWTGKGLAAKRPPRGGTTPGAIDYSEELALEILEWVSSGKAVMRFCEDADGKRIPGRPTIQTILKWRANIQGFREMFAEAQRDKAHVLVDEIVSIADTEDDHRRARNRIEARKWVAGRYFSALYGDRVAVTGAADGAPIKFESGKVTELTEAELMAIASKGMAPKI